VELKKAICQVGRLSKKFIDSLPKRWRKNMAQLRLFENGVELLTDEELLSLIVGNQQSARAYWQTMPLFMKLLSEKPRSFTCSKALAKSGLKGSLPYLNSPAAWPANPCRLK
jgi:hypothetical protein